MFRSGGKVPMWETGREAYVINLRKFGELRREFCPGIPGKSAQSSPWKVQPAARVSGGSEPTGAPLRRLYEPQVGLVVVLGKGSPRPSYFFPPLLSPRLSTPASRPFPLLARCTASLAKLSRYKRYSRNIFSIDRYPTAEDYPTANPGQDLPIARTVQG